MLNILLELANNGVIKTITDDNINGANADFQSKHAYELAEDSQYNYENTINFLVDLIDDLGLDVGNSFDKKMLSFNIDWGIKYEPTIEELKEKIAFHKKEISDLKFILKEKELEKDAN